MASQALYRRYRSQTFGELVGQEHIVQTLRNALAEGRIAHAYLFTGPRGVGKTTVARLLAKAVNCLEPMEQRPCGTCDMCQAIADGRAVDVIEMDAASHTSVEDAREIIERVQFRPTTARTKVYIVDECHMLSTAAFNALLKTLEEPPAHALFVLATTEVHKVPATILSRCQRFVFSRHSIATTAVHLREIAAQEGFTLDTGAPEAIARAATGSMRDALSVLDQLMSYGGGRITLEQVRALLGATESQEVTALLDALLAVDVTRALTIVGQVAGQGADLRQFARDVVERLRALMLLKAGADATLLDAGEDELATLHGQAEGANLAVLVGWVRLFGELDYQLRTSPYGQLPLELAVVEALTGREQITGSPQQTAAPPIERPVPTRPAAAAPRPTPPIERPAATAPRAPAPSARQPALAPAELVRAPAERAPAIPAFAEPPATPAVPPPAVPATDPFLAHLAQSPQAEEAASETPQPAVVQAFAGEGMADVAAEAEGEDVTPISQQASAGGQPQDLGETIEAANADAIAFEQVESVWPGVVRDVRPFDKTLQALLNSGVRPVDVKERTVVLEAPSEWLQRRLETVQLRHVVEKVLSKHMGANYSIRCVVEAQGRENPNVLREQIRTVRKDELVKAALNIFDADIIGVDEEKEPPL